MSGIGFGTNFNNDNYKVTAGNGLGPRTRIMSVATDAITQEELDAVVNDLTFGGVSGTNDAVTVAGISGAVGDATVYIAVQGTGVLTAATNWNGNTGLELALVADFTD